MKHFFTTIVVTILVNFSFAQEGVHIGIGAVPQNTWILNLDDEDASRSDFSFKPTWGYALWGKLGYNFAHPIGLHFYAMYSQQGQAHTAKDTLGAEHEVSRNLTYLKFPMYIHMGSDPGTVMFNLGFGPYYAMLLNSEIIEDGNEKYPGEDTDQLFADWEWGAAFYLGASIELAENTAYLNIDLRGDHTFKDIENKDAIVNNVPFYEEGRGKAKNFNIGLSIGLTFVINTSGGGGAGKYWIR